jgi:hypothetical protein
VGIQLDLDRAREVFDEALVLARSDADLPAEWLERSARVGTASSKTFTPMLGTALLAKATDDRVSALALKESAAHNAYSARGVGHGVLVPRCVEEGISLRTRGREPLNNQPFFRYETVHTDMRVVQRAEADLQYLVETLEQADFLRGADALHALAALLRTRLEDPASDPAPPLRDLELSPSALIEAAVAHAAADPEGGRRGQALVAAGLDLLHEEVVTARINDPSRDEPGDVTAGSGPGRSIHEVKQRPIETGEVLQLIDRASEDRLTKVDYHALRGAADDFDVDTVRARAERHGIVLSIDEDTAGFLTHAVLQSVLPAKEAALRLANRYVVRLREL